MVFDFVHVTVVRREAHSRSRSNSGDSDSVDSDEDAPSERSTTTSGRRSRSLSISFRRNKNDEDEDNRSVTSKRRAETPTRTGSRKYAFKRDKNSSKRNDEDDDDDDGEDDIDDQKKSTSKSTKRDNAKKPDRPLSTADRLLFQQLEKRMKALKAAKNYSSNRLANDFQFIHTTSDHKSEKRKEIAEKLLELGVVELCQDVWRYHFADDFLDDNKDDLRENMDSILCTLGNLTESGQIDLCRRILDTVLHADLLRYLDDKKLSPRKKSSTSTSRLKQAVAWNLMTVLYNVVQAVPAACLWYCDHEAVRIFEKFRSSKDKALSCLALLLQTHVAGDEDVEHIDSGDGSASAFLAGELKEALKNKDHRSPGGFTAAELLTAINRLALFNQNRVGILKSKALTSYAKLLDDACSQEEQLAAVEGIWHLSLPFGDDPLSSTGVEDIKRQRGCLEGILLTFKIIDCRQAQYLYHTSPAVVDTRPGLAVCELRLRPLSSSR